MKTITYRYYRQEFNYLQERVDALDRKSVV